MSKIATAERVSREPSDNFVFQRSLLAYHFAAQRIEGRVLEIGTGSGYGIEIIAPHTTEFVTMDKFLTSIESELPQNVNMVAATAPKLPFANSSFDYVISFQVIEHIKDDVEFVSEIHRVLRDGGKAIISTPNRPMSITRNPWHIREYTKEEFTSLLETRFSDITRFGVVGNETIMEYYQKNRESVRRITRFDILDLQHRLPGWMLRIPYDILNRLNRRRLLDENQSLTSSIKMDDYSITELRDDAFDLIYIAQKQPLSSGEGQ
ncbi:MAG: class I SAM-dependent methyltransferase [Rikenellaceae bacterium]